MREVIVFLKFHMKLRIFLNVVLWTMLLLAASVSCTPAPWQPISLASFTENYVDVSIYLERNSPGNYFLSATFTPPNGYHLYSKDIPITGVDGLGRPTLLELTIESQMRATGELTESARAEKPDFEPRDLLVYPLGALTLSLPVELPSGNDWVNDELKVTYMVCSANQCKPPVEGKIVSVRVPGVNAIK
jgi:hypothetical protein